MTTPTLVGRNGHPLSAEQMIGAYGRGIAEYDPEDGDLFLVYRAGLLTEHAPAFLAAGGRIYDRSTGQGQWAVTPDGAAFPVVCGDFIMIRTEDGPSDGRCGRDAVRDGACSVHAEEWDAYRVMSESQRAFAERSLERTA